MTFTFYCFTKMKFCNCINFVTRPTDFILSLDVNARETLRFVRVGGTLRNAFRCRSHIYILHLVPR